MIKRPALEEIIFLEILRSPMFPVAEQSKIDLPLCPRVSAVTINALDPELQCPFAFLKILKNPVRSQSQGSSSLEFISPICPTVSAATNKIYGSDCSAAARGLVSRVGTAQAIQRSDVSRSELSNYRRPGRASDIK